MPALSPAKGWATLQSQLLRDIRGFNLESLNYVRHVCVMDLTGSSRTDKREVPLAALMAEEAGSGGEETVREAEAAVMAMRKARAKVVMRTALDNKVHKVGAGLYIAAAGGAKNLPAIQAAGITHIVNASPLVPCYHADNTAAGLHYLTVNLYDSKDADIACHFEPVSAFITSALAEGGCVLVHCYAGQSRSAALLVAYLLLTSPEMRLGQALEQVQAGRPCACPNIGFIVQLKRLEGRLTTASAQIHKVTNKRTVSTRPSLEGKAKGEDASIRSSASTT